MAKEEELEKEVDEYFKSICGDYNEEYERTGKRHYWVGFDIKNAYLAGAEPREKRIAELEAQIEKMKCCEMCKNHNWQGCVFSSEERLGCINNKRKLFELSR